MEEEKTKEQIEVKTTGLLYLPDNSKNQKLENSLSDIEREVIYYDRERIDDENLNFKFLLPAFEKAKEINADFVVGFDKSLERIIIGYPNPDERYLVLNAHQQAAFLAANIMKGTYGSDKASPMIVKGIVLSQQIDKIVTKNEGVYKDSHAGYANLREILIKEQQEDQEGMAFDERNHVLLHPDPRENAKLLVEMVKNMVKELKAKEKSIFLEHVDLQIKYKLYGEKSFNISTPGKNKKIFDRFRTKPPSDAINEELVTITDFKKEVFHNKLTGRKGSTDLGQLDLVQLEYTSGLKITVEMMEEGQKLFLHLSDFIDCYNRSSFAEARKNIHDRLLKVVVSLGKVVINLP
ncbi:hypothetical protein [Pleomorphovibrio marinus]|uniref:hypothetical protein n=1 Tax=Pleomorphovibrio marinus TaxID=2164132 RepID=UPI000E0B458E|nr:hypothetical protein [Pleomorphovibrio marinus]